MPPGHHEVKLAVGTNEVKVPVDVKAGDDIFLGGSDKVCYAVIESPRGFADRRPVTVPPGPYALVKVLQPGELFAMSFATDSPFSKFLDYNGVRGELAQQTIVQYAGEPVMIDWTVSKPALQYSSTSFYDYVTSIQSAFFACPVGTTDARCQLAAADPPHANPDVATNTGTFTPGYFAALYDVTTGQAVATSNDNRVVWQIPARGATEPPHVYRAVVTSGGWTPVRPRDLSLWTATIGEYQFLGGTYTGIAPLSKGPAKCAVIQDTAIGRLCTQTKEHFELSALDHVTLQFQPLDVTIKTGTSSADVAAPAYVAAAKLSTGPLAWDSGDDDLPSPR
jgi:hypothetical protein